LAGSAAHRHDGHAQMRKRVLYGLPE